MATTNKNKNKGVKLSERETALLRNTASYATNGNSQEGTAGQSPGSSKKKFTTKPPYGVTTPTPKKPNRRSSSRNKGRNTRPSRNTRRKHSRN